MEIFNILLIIVLILLTAFFVASEFAVIRVRRSRIDQLIEEGNRRAIAAKQVTSHLDEYLSACQLGITITALGLGWLGEPTVEQMLRPLFEMLAINESVMSILSFAIAFSVVTFLHVVIGELAPKTIAIQRAEAVTLMISRPLIWFYRLMYPLIWTLNGSAQYIIRLLGFKSAKEQEVAHSEEELRMILSESYERGEINQSEYRYLDQIFEFDNRLAREIMVPRTEMVVVHVNDSLQTFIEQVEEKRFTRFPVIEKDKDHVLGIINLKEVAPSMLNHHSLDQVRLEEFIRPVHRFIDTIPLHDLLVHMQKERAQMAILMDEYGGTTGLVTIEDILEEIVGEIQDEFDEKETPPIQKIKKGHYWVDGKTLLSQINTMLSIQIEQEEIDTIGGWILAKDYEVQTGHSIEEQGYRFTIKEMREHQVRFIEIKKVDLTDQ